MSLINQMLRDLEQRQQTQGASPTLDVKVTPPQTVSQMRRWWWLPVVLFSVASWFFTETKPRIQPPAPQNLAMSSPAKVDEIRPSPLVEKTVGTVTKVTANKPANSESASLVAVADKQTATQASIEQLTNPPSPRVTEKSESRKAEPIKTAKLAPRQQAERLFQKAQDDSWEVDELYRVLTLAPEHLAARHLLLQRLSRQNPGELTAFIDESLQYFPNDSTFIKARAHLYLQQKNNAAALQILERVNASDDPGYLALLAATQQAGKHYQQATQSYQRLTQLQADKAEHWLGLAMAYDHLQQSEAASAAYRQALSKNIEKADIVDYINQRLNALAH